MPDKVPLNKRLLLINMIGVVVARLVNVALLIWVIQHLIKRIPADQYQLIPVIGSLAIMMPVLTDALKSGVARFMTEAYAKGDQNRVTQITSSMFFVNCLAATPLAVVIGLLVWQLDVVLTIPDEFVVEARWMLVLILGWLVLQLPLAPLSAGMYVRQRFVLQNGIVVLSTLVRAGVMVGLIVGVSPRPLWYAVAGATASLVRFPLEVWASRRAVPSIRVQWSAFRWPVVRSVFGFGIWSTLGRSAQSIRDAADPIILNKLATAVQVNAFYAGAIIDRQLRSLLITMLSPLEPGLTGLHATQQDHRLNKVFLRATRLVIWVGMLPVAPLIVFHEEVMRLWLGEEFELYRDSAWVLLLLMAMYPFYLTGNVLPRVAKARGVIGQVTRRTIFIELVNLGLTLILVGGWSLGAIGSATATLCAMMLRWVLYLPLMQQLAGIKPQQLLRSAMLPGLIPAVVAIALGQLLRITMGTPSPSPWMLAGLTAGMAVVYVAVLLAIARGADRADLLRVVAKVRRRPAAHNPD